jgi:hypothetical protein
VSYGGGWDTGAPYELRRIETGLSQLEERLKDERTAVGRWMRRAESRRQRIARADVHLIEYEQEAAHGKTANPAWLDLCVRKARAELREEAE